MAKANFTLKIQKDWSFSLEDYPDEVYTLPAMSKLSYEEADMMKRLSEQTDVTEQGPMVKTFILTYAPGLEGKGIGDMGYYEIFNAYALAQGKDKLGESKALQDS